MDPNPITRRDALAAAGAAGISALAADASAREARPAQPPPGGDSVAKTIFHVDPDKKMAEQAVVGHNRLHPDVPPVAEVAPGDSFLVECLDWTDNQIGDNDSADDVAHADLNAVHMLSGPFRVKGAEPGDPRSSTSLIRDRCGAGATPASSPRPMAAAS